MKSLFLVLSLLMVWNSELFGQESKYHLLNPEPVSSLEVAEVAPKENYKELYRAKENDGPRRAAKAVLVLGIVFTPITAVATIISIGMVTSAQSYNCSWAKNEGHEDDPEEGDDFKTARKNCEKARKEQIRDFTTMAVISGIGLGVSIFGIVKGIMMRRAAKNDPAVDSKHASIDVVMTGNRKFNLVWKMPL